MRPIVKIRIYIRGQTDALADLSLPFMHVYVSSSASTNFFVVTAFYVTVGEMEAS